MPDQKSLLVEVKSIAIDAGKVVGALALIGGFVYAVGNSSAQDFVEKVVKDMSFVTESDLAFERAKIQRLESSDAAAKKDIGQIQTDIAVQKESIENIEKLVTEQKSDIKALLRAVGRINDGP